MFASKCITLNDISNHEHRTSSSSLHKIPGEDDQAHTLHVTRCASQSASMFHKTKQTNQLGISVFMMRKTRIGRRSSEPNGFKSAATIQQSLMRSNTKVDCASRTIRSCQLQSQLRLVFFFSLILQRADDEALTRLLCFWSPCQSW